MTKSYGLPASCASRSAVRPAGPLFAEETTISHCVSISRRIRRLLALSSITRARRPVKSTGAQASSAGVISVCIAKGAVKEKMLPLPSLLSTEIVPPIRSTMDLEMVRPSPVPPYLRVVEESACVNRSKMLWILSAGIPMPVSFTENVRSTVFCSVWTADGPVNFTSSMTSPDSVNLTALPMKLMSTWRRRVGSPISLVGTPGATRQASSNSFLWARTDIMSPVCSTSFPRSNGMCSRWICPASTLEISRMSLIMFRRFSPASRKICTNFCCSLFRGVSVRRSAIPRMAFKGVRISWLMLARNSDFALLATSASSLARESAISICRRSVMSR